MFDLTVEQYEELLQVARRVQQKYTRVPPDELLHQTISHLLEKGLADKIRFPGFMYRAMTYTAMHNGDHMRRHYTFSLNDFLPYSPDMSNVEYLDFVRDNNVDVEKEASERVAAEKYLDSSIHAQARYLRECGYKTEEIAKMIVRAEAWVSLSLIAAHWVEGELCFRCPSCLTIRKHMGEEYFCNACYEKVNPQIRKRRSMTLRKEKDVPNNVPKYSQLSENRRGLADNGKNGVNSALSRCKNPKLRQKYLEKLEKINAAAD